MGTENRLTRPMSNNAEHPPSRGPRHWLLEREHELELLMDGAERAADGHGSVIVVEGPPGVGKSSLIDAARAVAVENGLAVLAAQGSELERALPFGLGRQLLPAVKLTADDPSASTDRERSVALVARFHEALVAAIFDPSDSARPAPHLVAIDDAQWGDLASLGYLAHLAMRAERLPVLMIVGIRTGDARNGAALEAVRSAATRTLRPQPLTDAAVKRLVREACGDEASDELAAACGRATDGNPFYLRELLRELVTVGLTASAEDVAAAAPASVLRSVLARLAGLGEDHSRLAVAVAILGDGAPLAWAAELAEITIHDAERAADSLAAEELLSPGEPLALAHPLIASALRADMGAFARARAHRRAFEILRRGRADADQLAGHLAHVRPEGDPIVVETLRDAAAMARERGDPGSAIGLLRRAMLEPPADEQRPGVLVDLARAEAIDSDPAAVVHLEQALAVLDGPRARAEAIVDLARLLHQAGDYANAAALAKRGRADLTDDDSLQPRLRAAQLAAGILDPLLHAEADDELSSLAREGADEAVIDPALRALLASHIAYGDGDRRLVAKLAVDAFAKDPLVDASSQGAALGFAGAALVLVDALSVAGPLLDAAAVAAEQRGAVLAGSIAANFLAQLSFHLGDLKRARSEAERSLQSYRAGWAQSAWSTPILIWTHLEQGRLDLAAAAIAIGEQGDPRRVEHSLLLEARAGHSLARGDDASALVDATAAIDHMRTGFGRIPARGWASHRLAAVAAHRLGHAAQASRLLEELLEQFHGVEAPREHGLALACAGTIAGGDRGLALLRRAVDTVERSESLLAQLHVRAQLGAAQRQLGDPSARGVLYGVFEQADAIGAVPLADRMRRELWSFGLRPRRAARTGTRSLTASEQRIARLAADGLTTPQIAQELYVTGKTVESHLSHIYRKLGISGRTELPTHVESAER